MMDRTDRSGEGKESASGAEPAELKYRISPAAFSKLPFYVVLERAFAAIEQGNRPLALSAIEAMRDGVVVWPHDQKEEAETIELQFDMAMDTLERLVYRVSLYNDL